MQVAQQLTAHDDLGAHARDELGIVEAQRARPVQAAIISAISFATFALLPIFALLGAGLVANGASSRIGAIAAVSLVSLAGLGSLGAHLGGARLGPAAARVTAGGALAMAITFAIGRLVGGVVS